MSEGLCPLCEAQEVFVLNHSPRHGGAGADMRLCQEITSGSSSFGVMITPDSLLLW